MTTTPNDAAVNAESDAKLVSASELRKLAVSWKGRDGDYGPYFTCADELLRLIERHATPQTQATHGEGVAVAWKDAVDFVRRAVSTRSKEECEAVRNWLDVIEYQVGMKATPSPTAAPALGELATVGYISKEGSYELREMGCTTIWRDQTPGRDMVPLSAALSIVVKESET